MWRLAVGLLALLALGPSLALVPDTGVIEISVEEVSCNSSRPIFQCNQTQCILETSLCNGIPECGNGRDESVAMCGCLPNEFRCSNSCIDHLKRCDRTQDCELGEDEIDCKTYMCPVSHYKCSNDFCIPLDKVCNFIDDCGDNSDEMECSHRKCWFGEFQCKNGECIPPGFVCDNSSYRGCIDGSDEAECAPSDFATCADGSRVHRFFWCNGWPDCTDNHADELNCRPCTGDSEYKCPNGRCIRKSNICDSKCDCVSDCSDETACEDLNYFTMHQDKISTCTVGHSMTCRIRETDAIERCIRREYICDGYNDCDSSGEYPLSDEYGCDVNRTREDKFLCQDSRALPLDVKCDHKPDCLHGDDEMDCGPISPCNNLTEHTCRSGQCIPVTSRCDMKFDCYDKSDEMDCQEDCHDGQFRCRLMGQCIPREAKCDYFVDCLDGTDEEDCDNEIPTPCLPNQFQCDNGQCIDISQRCVVGEDRRDGCADMSHLNNCTSWHCDEDYQFTCTSGQCILRNQTCNGKLDCEKTWEDEDGCPFQCSKLAPQCECQDIQINCTSQGISFIPDAEYQITKFYLANNSIHDLSFDKLDRLIYLDLSNNSIASLAPYQFSYLWRLQVLYLQFNQIRLIPNNTFYGLPSLRVLHLQGNDIEILKSMAFYGLSSLATLDLTHQQISKIEPGAFIGLRSLTVLDLSFNRLTRLDEGTLRGLPALLSLDIRDNHIKVIGTNVFRSVPTLNKLLSDEFRFCCLARHTSTCLPHPDEFSSCEDLMSNIVLRVCIWILGGVAIVGNISVIAWRSRYRRCNQVHSFLITNLALGDLLMGCYLLVIALVDVHYRGVYFIYDSDWRSSQLCSIAGFISTFSSELSVFTLTVITLDRFLAIIFPFRVRRLEMTRTKTLMAGGWTLAGLISALPLLKIDYFRNFYGRSGVCLALHITPDYPNGWEYSVFVFLVLNLVSFTTIACGYLWMFYVARTTQNAVSLKKERKTSESAMAWRMTLLVMTDAACWVPIITLGLLSVAGLSIPPQVFAWIAVFVLPLNAAVNPVLYTLSTTSFLKSSAPTFRRNHNLSIYQDCRRNHSTTNSTALLHSAVRCNSVRYKNGDAGNSLGRTSSVRWHNETITLQIMGT
ncbi:hypothetical protein M8J76_012726 [Diaphorina citri]|nr:hypothetical protein M8J76_012726 [Diaphorina citri]